LRRLLRLVTLDQWEALERDYPVDASPTASHRNKVLGLYLLAALVLFSNQFLWKDTWGLWVPETIREGPDRKLFRRMYWSWFISFCYVVPPLVYAKYVLRLGLADLGLSTRGFVKHLWLYGLGLAIVLPLVFLVSDQPHFLKTYPFYKDAARDWVTLLSWEVSYALQFMALEFFFRGFLLFGAVRLLGPWVIPAMVLPYMMIHWSKPELECLGSIIAGVALGVVALRTRAIYAGMIVHIGVAWSMDLLALWHKGKIQELLG